MSSMRLLTPLTPPSNSRSDIKHKNPDKPVAAHFNQYDRTLADLTIMVLEQMRSRNPIYVKKEIYQLDPLHPGGTNLDL